MSTYLQQIKDQVEPLRAESTRLYGQLLDYRRSLDSLNNMVNRLEQCIYNLDRINYSNSESDPLLKSVKEQQDKLKALCEQTTKDRDNAYNEREIIDKQYQKINSQENVEIDRKIKIMEMNKITSDIIDIYYAMLEPKLNGTPIHHNWVGSPSNYKGNTLVQGLSESAHERIFRRQLEEGAERKLKRVYEVGFKDSTLYLNVLDLNTKMMKVFTIKDNDDKADIQLYSYDNKTETFQKLCTFPSIPKDSLTNSFLSELV